MLKGSNFEMAFAFIVKNTTVDITLKLKNK